MESRRQAFHPFHCPWKSRRKQRDSHIPTATATISYIRVQNQNTDLKPDNQGVGQIKLPKWARYSCQTHTGLTNWINDAGEIAGKTDLPGPSPQNHDAVLWRNGVMTDLGTLPGDSCSNAYYVNLRGQVVGTSEDQQLCSILVGHHAFLWENGGPMIDLNTLIPPGSSLELTIAVAINDRGEIAGFGVPVGCSPQDADTCGRAFVLVPCVTDGSGANRR